MVSVLGDALINECASYANVRLHLCELVADRLQVGERAAERLDHECECDVWLEKLTACMAAHAVARCA